ncbi:MAG: alpha-amylase family glycosyl hydrolase [Chloroflexota bacterium]
MTERDYLWWQTGIVYQVYPRSYQDANGDGVGDLEGIESRLDYLKWLGLDAVWVSPCFKSPMKDFGYDVADYRDIDPLFGTMADLDSLLEATHARGMKLILDYVPNHTSDQHPWFVESRSSRDNPKRDWYIWKDARPDGSPPNNWLANFGGIGWEWDEHTQQFYYHAFLVEQPDLNWRNPEVQTAMIDVLRFWLDKGVDGFRVDVMNHLIKDAEFRDNPLNPRWKPGDHPYRRLVPTYSADRPEVHDIVAKMRTLFNEYDERVIIGEIYLPIDRLVAYYGQHNNEAHLPFNFQLISRHWDARVIAAAIDKYEAALPSGAWPNWVLGNHDRSRVATRIGRSQACVAAMLLLSLRGTPTMYQGDELGMEDVAIPAGKVQDPPGLTIGEGRDPERTPMQWDTSPNAGFTKAAEPWLPVDEDYAKVNVEVEREDPASVLNLYKALIELRRSELALTIGHYRPVPAEGDILTYIRDHEGQRIFAALNFGGQPQTITLDAEHYGSIALSTSLDRKGEKVAGQLQLRADEGVLVRLD